MTARGYGDLTYADWVYGDDLPSLSAAGGGSFTPAIGMSIPLVVVFSGNGNLVAVIPFGRLYGDLNYGDAVYGDAGATESATFSGGGSFVVAFSKAGQPVPVFSGGGSIVFTTALTVVFTGRGTFVVSTLLVIPVTGLRFDGDGDFVPVSTPPARPLTIDMPGPGHTVDVPTAPIIDRFTYPQGASLPVAAMWLRDDNKQLVDLSAGWTFTFKIGHENKAAVLLKTTGIAGLLGSGRAPDGVPNLSIAWAAGELAIPVGRYGWKLTGTKGGLVRIWEGSFIIESTIT